MKVIIAEKPSVAREIAHIVGAKDKKEGYLQGNDYAVTWAYGHLVALALPEVYGKRSFQKENLPILPEVFEIIPRQVKTEKGYKADIGAVAQLKVIGKLFKECDSIIVATDAGREGELIFRYIYEYLGCAKPFDRLWISSLTEKAIRKGLENLKCGAEYDNLYYSARARSESDWLIGINATQAVTIAAGRGAYSLGRVQTPTLCMICSRYAENSGFTSSKFWKMTLSVKNGEDEEIIQLNSVQQWVDEQKANNTYRELKTNTYVTIQKVEDKETTQEPPLLYDLTALQKDANSKHSFSADKTLSLAQKLYELKVTTYPRTGSSYISEDVFAEIPSLIKSLCIHSHFGSYAKGLKNLNNRSVNDAKVTDHHALLITGRKPKELSTDEKIIYDMIAGRMLEAFSEKCIKEITTVSAICGELDFTMRTATIKQNGWRGVWNINEDKEDTHTLIANWKDGDTLAIKGYSMSQGVTKPKPLHTEGSLLAAMETAGKDLEDETLREKMKGCGIGTPATRASIIETLLSREYIVRSKKSLVPTEKGMALYSVVKPMRVADVEMTGQWEEALSKIESGEMKAETFRKGIEVYATQVTKELLDSRILFPNAQPIVTCPKCGTGRMQFYAKVVKCDNSDCALPIFRQMCEKQLTDKHISQLLSSGKSDLIKGFKSKTGKSFDATLCFDDDYKVKFVFTSNKMKKKR